MIKYSLICDQEHNFEAWFSDYDTCEKQLEKSSVECPLCSSKKISNLERIEVFERVRDIKFKNSKLYLFLEETASIGMIDFTY